MGGCAKQTSLYPEKNLILYKKKNSIINIVLVYLMKNEGL